MNTPPDGTVSLLFADVEGSTRLAFALDTAWFAAQARYHRLVGDAVRAHAGFVFKYMGDGVHAAFLRAQDAIAAAIDAQRAIQRAAWSDLDERMERPRVRIGLHSGEAVWDADSMEYAGVALHVAKRVTDVANGDQIVISSAIEALSRAHLRPGVRLRPMGPAKLKDVPVPEPLALLLVDGLVEDVRPLRTQLEDPAVRDAALGDADLAQAIERTLDWIRRPNECAPPTLDQQMLVRHHRPLGWSDFLAKRVTEWTHPRLRLDRRFVNLTLLLDEGDEEPAGRWAPHPERYHELRDVLTADDAPAIVLIGDPGAGKTTLLARFEFDTALDALDGDPRVPFFVPLASFGAGGAEFPAPGAWLVEQWALQNPGLPPLDHLMAMGRLVLLLDGLNEMPHPDYAGYWARIQAWRRWIAAMHASYPGCRAIFSCRTQDYAAPLSTPELPIPQVRVEPLDDGQVKQFIGAYAPERATDLWAAIDGSTAIELLRSPFMLRLFIEQDEAPDMVARNPSAWFTALMRRALVREASRGSRMFGPDGVLTPHDVRRLTQAHTWRTPYELPEGGILVAGLSELAHRMQRVAGTADGAQVRLGRAEARDLVASLGPNGGDVLRAGLSLGLLVEDLDRDEIAFAHQLLQEYCAARRVACRPDVEVAASEWRAATIQPPLEATLATLATPDPLPPPPPTPWDATMLLAAPMVADADRFVGALADVNLTLAGRAAVQRDVRVTSATRESLAWRLVERSRDPEADVRARIAAGLVLGDLGDPRYERGTGPDGRAYLLPPFVDVPAGIYTIGTDGSIYPDEAPIRKVLVDSFQMATFPVTNAEYALFMDAGGYEDERWWATPDAAAWRRGEGTMEGARINVLDVLERFRAEPGSLEERFELGELSQEQYEQWRGWLALDERTLQTDLRAKYPDGLHRAPRGWHERELGRSTQPVVGVTWFEASAYARWLGHQSGRSVGLPTEVQWEAAARGPDAYEFPFGNVFDPGCCNSLETHVRRPTPVGVFPSGDAACGAADFAGNGGEWTALDARLPPPSSIVPSNSNGSSADRPPNYCVQRGGSWNKGSLDVRCSVRLFLHAAAASKSSGFRLMLEPTAVGPRFPFAVTL